MKTGKNHVVGTLLLIAMLAAFAVPAFATTKVLSLPSGQTWVSTPTETRSGAYAYVLARNESVFPDSGTDGYELIQCRVLNSIGEVISSGLYVTLDEKDSGSTKIYFRDGCLNYTSIVFQFRGNSDNAAKTVVTYNPL